MSQYHLNPELDDEVEIKNEPTVYARMPSEYSINSPDVEITSFSSRQPAEPNGSTKRLDDPDHPAENEITNPVMRKIETVQTVLMHGYKTHETTIKRLLIVVILVAFHVYVGFAIAHSAVDATALIALLTIAWIGCIYYMVTVPLLAQGCNNAVAEPITRKFEKAWRNWIIRWVIYCLLAGALVTFLAVDTRTDRTRLIPFGGLIVFIGLLFVFSNNPAKIRWRPVWWGLGMQFVMGILVLRWDTGRNAFDYASNQVVIFLEYTDKGTDFVYGFLSLPPNICGMDRVFTFTSLQVIIYFGAIVAVLYYYGIMQFILTRIAWAMQLTLGTTATESLNAAACIFLGQSEAPLLIKPYLSKMTRSELHAVMTGGFSCIAGSLFAAYISFGACPRYLLSATLMSAPAALAVSKLFYPETEKSHVRLVSDLELPPATEKNALECISNGATSTVELVWAIVANLIVFLALLAFLDATIGWLGGMVGYPALNFELIIGYVFFPLAYIMGSGDDSFQVATLMGTKTVLNEFIAYQKLGRMIDAGQISGRGQMIATYALCGFSNISSVGIQMGILGGMCPERKDVFAQIALRALVAGSFACFMTACVAGVLVEDTSACGNKLNSTCLNITKLEMKFPSLMSVQ